MKKCYDFHRSALIKAWEDSYIGVVANSFEEALELAKEGNANEYYDCDYNDSDGKVLPPKDHEGFSTLFIYDDDYNILYENGDKNLQNKHHDNFDLIYKYLKSQKFNDFYFLQVIQRKKDGNDVPNDYKVLKSYYIFNADDLYHYRTQISKLCKDNNARAYINLNIRKSNEIALECIQELATMVSNNTANMGSTVWDDVCNKYISKNSQNTMLIDVDSTDKSVISNVRQLILEFSPSIELEVPTVKGYHFICKEFNERPLQQKIIMKGLCKVDVRKNHPTLLYF